MVAETNPTLLERLTAWVAQDVDRSSVAVTVVALASAFEQVARLIAAGPLAPHAEAAPNLNAGGDVQKPLDLEANRLILAALKSMPVAYYASEEEPAILSLASGAPLAVAVDPLDGSSNIEVDLSIGSIFSIFQRSYAGATASFLRPGREQLAAGYVLYGPHTALVLSVGCGVDLYVLDPELREFRLVQESLKIPADGREFAINASNYRHWLPPVRTYIDDCLEGVEGPQGRNFNMRWIASLVAEAHRIFARGGVFLYPADRRPGYEQGRLRHVYEAAPIAFLAEQAGGGASDGNRRILDKMPASLHERTPLVFGSARNVESVSEYHLNPAFARDMSPLFQERGLFNS
jgi:fructose-1,6-bisphosphatase I